MSNGNGNGEIWGVGRTFLLCVLVLALSYAGWWAGKMPTGTLVELIWAVLAVYGVKTIGHAGANAIKVRKNGGTQ